MHTEWQNAWFLTFRAGNRQALKCNETLIWDSIIKICLQAPRFVVIGQSNKCFSWRFQFLYLILKAKTWNTKCSFLFRLWGRHRGSASTVTSRESYLALEDDSVYQILKYVRQNVYGGKITRTVSKYKGLEIIKQKRQKARTTFS